MGLSIIAFANYMNEVEKAGVERHGTLTLKFMLIPFLNSFEVEECISEKPKFT